MSNTRYRSRHQRVGKHRLGPVTGSTVLLLLLLTTISGASAAEADGMQDQIKQGRAKAQSCTRCHGRNGLQHLANISGWEQSLSAFITVQLVAFRGGQRNHVIMNSIAKPLTDEDILQISSWFESLGTAKKITVIRQINANLKDLFKPPAHG